MLSAVVAGFAVGGGLIVAIGAQNAFVLSQGVRREHHLAVALVCALCDAALIALGVGGAGALIAASPGLARLAAWAGAAFLFAYGLRAFASAWQGGCLRLGDSRPAPRGRVLLTTLALTLLNPHVYLDTVVLLGSISAGHAGSARLLFGLGAVAASFTWFFALAAGGRALAPLFVRPATWRLLDILVGATMWGVGLSLVL